MKYLERLRQSAKRSGAISCMGIDPVMERIPIRGRSIEQAITTFYSNILDRCKKENVWPAACKPNYAYFAQYGWDGLRALKAICEKIREMEIPLILDVKRGDIGTTAKAYAKEAFEFWNADALTVSPYMGFDSLEPFFEWTGKEGKGVYVLVRTSNAGAKDFQDLPAPEGPLYERVAHKLLEWTQANEGIGAVVGATQPDELRKIHAIFSGSNVPVPYLIPGVGGQGGDAVAVVKILAQGKGGTSIHRVNSSSAINYAYEKSGSKDYAQAAVSALRDLNDSTSVS